MHYDCCHVRNVSCCSLFEQDISGKAEVVEKKKSASKSAAKDDEAVAVALAAIMSKR